MKIKLTIIILMMMISSIGLANAGTDTIIVVELITGGTLDEVWNETDDGDWAPANDGTLDIYRADVDTETAWSIPDNGTTEYRGMMMARINVTTRVGDMPHYGLIFNYHNASAWYYVGLDQHDDETWWQVGYYNGTTKTGLNETNISGYTNVTENYTVVKCIYNPYNGHIMFKAWDTTRTEPLEWNIDYIDAENLSIADDWVDNTTTWGIYAAGVDDEPFRVITREIIGMLNKDDVVKAYIDEQIKHVEEG